MSIHVALHHKTSYAYSKRITLGPQVIRLRPAPHCRTPVESYSLRVSGGEHFLNWQQDPFGNYLARCVFNEPAEHLDIEVDLVASLSSINPFDFFLEPAAEKFPFVYDADTHEQLKPYLALPPAGPRLHSLLGTIDRTPRKTIDLLVDLNQRLQQQIDYVVRMEPGVQTADQTLEIGRGSCQDSAWLLCQALRHLGFATRFVSGYLIQLVADQKSLDGPSGPEADFTDLHAWTEVYLPGAGWVGLDPTSGLLAGEGHLPLACTPQPISAAPITGGHEPCDVDFSFEMSVSRVYEDPRVTKPYTEEQWDRIESLGHQVDERLRHNDVRLTMGGEPTFVSIDDMEGDEWNTAAVGPNKRRLADDLMLRLKQRFGQGGLLHYGQGKWYPGESLPRWSFHCYWRKDGQPVWQNDQLFARVDNDHGHTIDHARRFAHALAQRLEVNTEHAIDGYEDSMYYAWRERRLPANVDPRDSKLDDPEERERIARVFEQGLTAAVGVALPLRYCWWEAQPRWESGAWVVRSEEMFLIPGDSPMGYRLPLIGLLYTSKVYGSEGFYERDPLAVTAELPAYESLRRRMGAGVPVGAVMQRYAGSVKQSHQVGFGRHGANGVGGYGDDHGETDEPSPETHDPEAPLAKVDVRYSDPANVIRTALCVEPRGGVLHVFMPPCDRLEVYLDLIAAVEDTAESLDTPVIIEGYEPPHDHRLQHIKVTPDPGVLEVNVHPAESWDELVNITTGVYEDARNSRLGTEKFDLDGTHTGSGGGNHVVLGG
ncbi:MAG: transglutaminase family protein, partial [Planctomycetales bacterium]|nr:transglutaminase family protein [Planctomycetales bacterium]